MAIFHRLTVPTYDGGLPVDYDLINDPTHPSVGGSGVSVLADNQKSGGVNDGTYFVAFGEDARSSFANRGLKALSENTDLLDDYFHQDLAIPVRTSDEVAGVEITSIDLTGDVFVGVFGTVNNADNRNLLVQILDENDDAISGSNGSTVHASLIHDGSSNNVVGTEASGFRSGTTTIALNTGIPVGTTYRVYYGERGNLVGLPVDALLEPKITEVPIKVLATRGLDGEYRLRTSITPGLSYDTPGAGAVVVRDGQAPEVTDLGNSTPLFSDPINAMWIARTGGSRGVGSNPNGAGKGATGFVSYESRRSIVGIETNEGGAIPSASNFLAVWTHDFIDVVADVRTQVTPSLDATLNPSGADARLVRLNVADFFHTGGESSVAVGYDLLEITRESGEKQFYVIGELDPAQPRDAFLIHMDNSVINFPADETVQVRWVSLTFQQGAAVQSFRESVIGTGIPVRWKGLFHAQAPYLTNDPETNEVLGESAAFFACSIRRFPTLGTPTALEWGGFDGDASGAQTSTYAVKGKLYGDGSIDASLLALANKSFTTSGTSTSGTWDPRQDGSVFTLLMNYSGGPATHTLSFASGYVPSAGEMVYVVVAQASVTPGSIVWPSEFLFSGADSVPGQSVLQITKYEGIYLPAPIGKFLMTKTVY